LIEDERGEVVSETARDAGAIDHRARPTETRPMPRHARTVRCRVNTASGPSANETQPTQSDIGVAHRVAVNPQVRREATATREPLARRQLPRADGGSHLSHQLGPNGGPVRSSQRDRNR
jgi:hypothetical protein